MEESIKIILEAVSRAQGELAATVKQINEITAATKKQRNAFEEADKILQKHKTSLLAIGAAAAAVAAAMVVLVKSSIKLGDELLSLSQKSGVSVENLSTLAPVAKNANLELNELAGGLKFLNKSINDSQVATSESAQAFRALGVSATNSNGTLKDTFSLLLESADAFAAHADGAGKTALAMQIFGRAGANLIPLLNQGSAGIKDQQQVIRDLGGEMSGKFASDADAFNDQLGLLRVVVTGAAKDIATSMLPALNELAAAAIRNKDIIVPVFKAMAIAVTAAGIAFAGFKVFTLVQGLVSLAALIKPMIISMGLLGSTATVAGGAAAASAIVFATLTVALGLLAAGIGTVIVALDAYKAAQGEAAAEQSLMQGTERIRARLRIHVKDLQAAGKLSAGAVQQLNDVLNDAGKSDNVDKQMSANAFVIAAIKDKVSEENRFAVAARGGVDALTAQKKLTDKPVFLDPKVLEDRLKQEQAVADGQEKIGQTMVQMRLAQQKQATDAEIAILDRSLAKQGISVEAYESERQALLRKRISNEVEAAEAEAAIAQAAASRKIAFTNDPSERASLNAEITNSEITLQAKLNEIQAQGAAEQLSIAEQAAQEEIKIRTRILDAGLAVTQSGGNVQAADADVSSAKLDDDLANRRISEFQFGEEKRALELEAVERERQLALESVNIEAEKFALQLQETEMATATRTALVEAAETVHQNNLLTIEQTASSKRIKIATAEQGAKKGILNSQLEGTKFTLDLMTQAASQYGKKGVAIAKVTATASALISTYQSAVAAYAAVAGIMFVGPVLAPIAAAAAVAAGLANIAKINSISFAEGGLVPGAPSRKDNRVANVASGEYIFPSTAVSKMGASWFAALHAQILSGKFRGFELGGSVPRISGSSFAAGGLVGAGKPPGDQPDLQNISVGFVNTRNALREFQRADGIRLIVDQLEQRQNQVFS